MDNNATRDASLLARFFLTARAALDLWRRNRRAAFAADRAYVNARGGGATHDVATEAAFRILTKEERPELPDVVSAAQSVPAAGADTADNSVGRPGWPTPQGST